MSKAADYRNAMRQKQLQAAARGEGVTDVLLPYSELTFKLKVPDVEAWLLSGRLPQSLLEAGRKAWQAGFEEDKMKREMSDNQIFDSLIFMREVVREACVSPRLVVGGDEEKDELDPSDLHKVDFTFIFEWVMEHAGVKNIFTLRTFRGGSKRGATGTGTNRKKQRKARQRANAD